MADEINNNAVANVSNNIQSNLSLDNKDYSTQNGKESTIFGISIRGLLALCLILTVCAMSLCGKEVKEPLYTLVMVISSFYFGHQVGKNSSNNSK